MHHRARDITGLRVGYLTALRYHGSNGRRSIWEVRCACGKTILCSPSELLKQKKRDVRASCGCMKMATISARNTRHGMSAHPAYAVYRSMLARCLNPEHPVFNRYGGRGIQVCARWLKSFENFWSDMAEGYERGLTLERQRNDRGYSKANCIWATRKQQASNTRANRNLDTPVGRMTAAQAADHYGIKRTTLLYRLNHGWELKQALTTPADFRNRCGI